MTGGAETPSVQSWTLQPIREVLRHYQGHVGTPEERTTTISQMAAAVPVWRTAKSAFAEHFGLTADAYYWSFRQGGPSGHLDKAIAYLDEVNGITGVSQEVLTRLEFMSISLDISRIRRDDGEQASAACLSQHCARLRGDLQRYAAPSLLNDLATNLTRWAASAADEEQWPAAADAFELAARVVDNLFRILPSAERLETLGKFRGVDAAAASALSRVERFRDAVATLESSRQRAIRSLRGNSDLARVLAATDPELLHRYEADHAAWVTASRRWPAISDPIEAERAREEARNATEKLLATTKLIHLHPGLESLLIRPNFTEVAGACQESPILYVSTSVYDTVLLLVLPDQAVLRARCDLKLEDLDKILRLWLERLNARDVAPDRNYKLALAVVGRLLEQYFTPALKAVLTYPFTQDWKETSWRWGPVTVVVGGPLSFLPVHRWSPMLVDDEGNTTRIMPLMFAPSARQAARARRAPRPTGSSRSLLSLADPEPRLENRAPLPCARLESATIARSARRRQMLHGAAATPSAFLKCVGDYEVVHLACHAARDPASPLTACLELAGGALSGGQIISDLALDHVALVVLSACRSGQPHPELPEESVDLGSLFLAAGARAVLSNLWPVDDLAAALFVWRLFDTWGWGEGLSLPAAVSEAGLWLRELTVDDLRELAANNPGWRAPIRRWTRRLDGDLKRFNEPYYWAAFSLTGA